MAVVPGVGAILVGLVSGLLAVASSGAELELFSEDIVGSNPDGNVLVGSVVTGVECAPPGCFFLTSGLRVDLVSGSSELYDWGLSPNFDVATATSDNGAYLVGKRFFGSRPPIWHDVATPPTTYVELPDDGVPHAVSNDGVVIVGSAGIAGQPAVRWVNQGPAEVLALGGDAYAVTADGAVIVGAADGPAANVQAFRWEGGQLEWLPLLAGPNGSSEARDVSDDGSIVVGRARTDGQSRAVRWVDGEIEILHDDTLQAYAISPDGTYVVGEGSQGAFLWSAGEGFFWIRDRLLESGLANVPSDLMRGITVSNDGSVIVGFRADGSAFRAILDPPATPSVPLGVAWVGAAAVLLLAIARGRLRDPLASVRDAA